LDWRYDKGILDLLAPYERNFVSAELSRSLTYYERRVEAIGFKEKGDVLDVACGIGQWTIALARGNKQVVGIDTSSARLMVAQNLIKNMGGDNATLRWADMNRLPFEDKSFDAVFCYGALMFGNIPRTLREFARVLRPWGRLYTNVNGYGWYIHLLLGRACREKNIGLAINTLGMVARLLLCKQEKIPLSRRRIRRWLREAGFTVIHTGADGSYAAEVHRQSPIYPRMHYGLSGVIEILAELERKDDAQYRRRD
jgi:SAM-dependent methyltransferase